MPRIHLRLPWILFALLSSVLYIVAVAQDKKQVQNTTKPPKSSPVPIPPIFLKRDVKLGTAEPVEPFKKFRASRFDNSVATRLGLRGNVAYGFNTATYGAAGFAPSWKNYFAFVFLGNPSNKQVPLWRDKAFSIQLPQGYFAYDPQFSPQANYLIFKMGIPYSSSGSFEYYVWDLKSQKLQKVSEGSSSFGQARWSPNERYISYFQDDASSLNSITQLQLFIYNMQTGKNSVVAQGDILPNSMSWMPEDRLVFSAKESDSKESNSNTKNSENVQPNEDLNDFVRPNIYETTPVGVDVKLLMRDSYRPSVSPDGKYVAFFGSVDPDRDEQSKQRNNYYLKKPRNTSLIVATVSGENRVSLQKASGERYSSLHWTYDSQYLIVIEFHNKASGKKEARIKEFALPLWKERAIATITYGDKFGLDADESQALFRPLRVSNDGAYLFFQLSQSVEDVPEDKKKNGLFLKTVNLKTGAVSTLCRIGSTGGLDWHDESVPITAPIQSGP